MPIDDEGGKDINELRVAEYYRRDDMNVPQGQRVSVQDEDEDVRVSSQEMEMVER